MMKNHSMSSDCPSCIPYMLIDDYLCINSAMQINLQGSVQIMCMSPLLYLMSAVASWRTVEGIPSWKGRWLAGRGSSSEVTNLTWWPPTPAC